MADWFYVRDGQQLGPVPLESLQQLAASGQLKPGDLVWTQGMAAWQPASQVAGVFAAGSAPPQLPPMAVPYATPRPYGPSLGENPGARWLLPVGRSGWAIAAGYLGLFSFVVLPAPLAVICSIIAIRDIRRHPNRHGMGRAIFGLVTGILFSIVLGIMLFTIAWKR
jgi:hypothetical protein